MIKRISLSLLSAILILALVSCAALEYGHAELRISLPDSVRALDAEGFDSAYSDSDFVVGINRISFAAGFNQGIPDYLTAEEFATFYMKQSERDAVVNRRGDFAFYEYVDLSGGVSTFYLASFHRSKYAYFLVLFACDEAKRDALTLDFLSYADSVIFTK